MLTIEVTVCVMNENLKIWALEYFKPFDDSFVFKTKQKISTLEKKYEK